MSEQRKSKKIFDFSLLRRVFRFATPYRSRFYWSIFLSIVLAVISPVRPWLIQLTINNGLKDNAHVWFLKGAGSVIIGITIIQLVLLLLETICRFIFTFFTASLVQSVVRYMRIATYKKI